MYVSTSHKQQHLKGCTVVYEHTLAEHSGFIWSRHQFFPAGLISDVGLKVCTLERPTRDISSADIQCPGQAPVELIRLMEACRKENPRERPSVGDVCDSLENILFCGRIMSERERDLHPFQPRRADAG